MVVVPAFLLIRARLDLAGGPSAVVLVLGKELGELLQGLEVVVSHVDVHIRWVQHDVLRAEMGMGRRHMLLVQRSHSAGDIATINKEDDGVKDDLRCNGTLVMWAKIDTRLMNVAEETDLLGHENVHDISFLVEAHSFNRQQVLVLQIL